ncbi:hypothetical protein GF345_03500 [Candidatus Woesearchaeota archaeon]|nr:hypothetical protein [Candidatus Woesearchaeota archaeon]
MKSKKVILAMLLMIAILGYLNMTDFRIADYTGRSVLDPDKQGIPSEYSVDPVVMFCPRDDCAHTLEFIINNSDTIHCAFFDLDIPELIGALEAKNASVIVDADNHGLVKGKITHLKKDTRTAFMHNKFCIFDNSIILTGSMNPTHNGNNRNNNNMIIISSSYLAENYEAEFQEMWNGEFGKGGRTANPVIMLNDQRIENWFCPEDWCANKIMNVLEQANESIYFMTFSFTHDDIGDILIEKHKQGVEVKGIFETRQNRQYSEMDKLNKSGIHVMTDTNPAAMHHKVFIIDNRTVITGSMNPTKSGDTRNDENVLIVHGPRIAKAYLQEFGNIFNNFIK